MKHAWYVTPQEFADLVVETMEELHYFKADEFSHPEDISITFAIVAEALAKGMGYAGQRVFEEERRQRDLQRQVNDAHEKQAMMKTKNLKKTIVDDPEYP